MGNEGLVPVLRAMTYDQSSNIVDLLNKALFLAGKINNDELAKWAEKELYGYNRSDEIPSYRYAPCVVMVGNSGTVHQLKFSRESDRNNFGWEKVCDGIKSIEEKLSNPSQDNFDIVVASQLRPVLLAIAGAEYYDVFFRIKRVSLTQILDFVRISLREKMVELKKQGVTGTGFSFDEMYAPLKQENTISIKPIKRDWINIFWVPLLVVIVGGLLLNFFLK